MCPGTFQISLWMGWRGTGGTKMFFEELALAVSPLRGDPGVPNPTLAVPGSASQTFLLKIFPWKSFQLLQELWIRFRPGNHCRRSMAFGYPWKNASCLAVLASRGALEELGGPECGLNPRALPLICSELLLLLVADVNQAVCSNHQRQSVFMAEYSKGCSSLLFQQRQI